MIMSDFTHKTEAEDHLQKGADWLLERYQDMETKRQGFITSLCDDADARFESAQIAARQGDTARVRALLEPVFAAARMSLFIIPEDNPIADTAYVEEKVSILSETTSRISGTTSDPVFSASVLQSADAARRDFEEWETAKQRFKPVADRLYRELDGRDFFATRSELKKVFSYLWQRCKPFVNAALPEAACFYRLLATFAPVFQELHSDPVREMFWPVPVRDAVFQSTGATPDSLDLYRFLLQPRASAVADGGDVWEEVARTLDDAPVPFPGVAVLLESIRTHLPPSLHILTAYRAVLPFCQSSADFDKVAAFFKETLSRTRKESFIIREGLDNEWHLAAFPGLHTVFLEFDKNPSSSPLFEIEPLRNILPASVLSNQDSALRFRLQQESELADVLEAGFGEHAAAFFIRVLISQYLPDDENLQLKMSAYLSVLRNLNLVDDGTASYDGNNPARYHEAPKSDDPATDMKNRVCLDKMRDLMRALSGPGENHVNSTTVQIRTIESFLLPLLHYVIRAGADRGIGAGELRYNVLRQSFDAFDIKRKRHRSEDYYPITNRNAHQPASLPHPILTPELCGKDELEALLLIEWQYYFSRFLSDFAGYIHESDPDGGWVPHKPDFCTPGADAIELPSMSAKKRRLSLTPRDYEDCETRMADLRHCAAAMAQSARAWGLEKFADTFRNIEEWSKHDVHVVIPVLLQLIDTGSISYNRRGGADRLTTPSVDNIAPGVPVTVRKMPVAIHIPGVYALGLFADFDKNVEHTVQLLKKRNGAPLPSVAQAVFDKCRMEINLRMSAAQFDDGNDFLRSQDFS